MYKSWLSVGVIITLLHIQITSGDLSIDQKIREGNRKRKLDVRLVDGISKLEGRVEIRYNDTWGTICDDRFNRKAAAVVCHMLGYRRLRAKPYKRSAYGEGNGPIWLDDLKCHGNEASLGDCKHLPWGFHNCGHKEDAGVKCEARKKDERNRMLTLELDMVVKEGERPKLFQRNKSNRNNAVKDQSKLWMKDIFYMLEDGIDSDTEVLIRNALDEWERYSCLHFSKDVLENHYNKIVFTVNQGEMGCASTYVGMKQGPQEIHLANDCLHRDIILHEIGHALGFYHEHNRADRDKYIRVRYENIAKGFEHQFIKLHKDEYEDFGKPYDYKSIMHYGRLFFSRNESQNLVTMETVEPEFHDVIGKVKHPSFLDYKILNAMYECSAGCSFVRCPGGGFLGKDCQCYCEGNQDNEPITPCSKEKNCQKPSINEFLFDVLDRVNETVVDMTRDTYPDNTVFNVFSTNLNCSIVSEHLCDRGTWLGGMPDCPVELGIKLIDGSDDEGIIELMLNEQWRGYICDDNWDDNDATVACRMMGFEFGKARGENLSKVNESLQILLDDVKCSGSESTISDCDHNGWGKHDCDHSEVAAIKCFPYIDTQQKDVLNNNDCGKIPLKGTKRRKREVRIVGGAEAVKGMYPWQVGIQRMRGRWIHWCGGTILSSHWILTAAHCFDDLTFKHDGRNEKMNYEDFRVLIGDHDRTKEDEQEQIFHIEYVVKHWQYSEADRINPENDIALLKIDTDSGAVFNYYVQPACLPGENVSIEYGMKCEVSGWGKRTESGEIQNKLRSVKVPIIEDRKCEHLYKQYPIDTQRVFCAGDVNARLDTCQGDSGGPLVCDIKDRSTVFGITSWGLGCGRSNDPGVYTKVSAFVSWIKQQIGLHDFVETDPPSCPSSDFHCESTGFLECIDKRLRCDGYADCSDSSDEKDCLYTMCRRDEFSCRNGGRCLPLESRCNSVIECADRSDELGCDADRDPSVRIEPRYQKVDEGTQVLFNCIATGKPTPSIEWYRGSNREINPDATVTSDGVFRIPRVRLEDESDYYCKATNDLGTTEIRTILYVTRVDRPEIIIIVRQTKYVSIVGDTARLECYAEDASGRVTLFWSRATGLPSGSSQDNGVLTIPDVQPSYAGNYVCTGTETESGRVSTAIAVLEVQIEDESAVPIVSLEPEKITIPMGTTGTLRCKVTGKPEPKVSWLKSREELAPNHQVNGNVLRITQATMADRGIYVCRAENAAGLDQDWTVVEVERRMRPKIDLYPNTTQRVAVGSSALFQCRVMYGDPPPTITWSRVGGAPVPADKVETMENGVIMFKQVTQAEQGGYMCAAENKMGTTTATATLIVEGPPTITIQPSKTVYALIGQRVTLECTADGDPLPAVYWIEPVRPGRWDVPLEVDPAYTGEVTYGTAIVDIASVDRGDEGTYKCVASNTGGQTEDRVQLVVREGETRGVSISGPSTLSVVEGQSVELICSATELRNPVIRWRRRQGVLPAGHSVRNGVLTLSRFRTEYAGEYICSTTVQQQSYEASVFIIITVAPRLTISPQRITSRAGDTIQLRCTASGGGPFNIEWSRIGAQMNPSATERDGILEIRQVTAADAGRYRCVVQSGSGTNDGYALVEIEVPPSVIVEQRDVYTEVNRIARLRCDASGSPIPQVRWEKEGDQLPAQHKIQDGVLTIYGVQEQDAGRYICTAASSSGSSRDYAVLHVTTNSEIDNRGENVETQVVNVGDRVSMECIVTGTPLPTITWSRDDGPLPKGVILGDGILIIPEAKIEDAGTYTCLAVNEAGSISSKVVLYVRAQPLISAPSASTAALGDSAKLVCDDSGYPSPSITWFRKDGELPSDYTIVDGDLFISRVRPEDAGTYVCHAENEYGRTDTPVSLSVGDLVPYFTQNPTSYISYQPMNDVYLDFDILLSLKPESTEGMVLYNCQYEDGGGDFVCFGLNEGYPEFRFDVGSGPAIIRGNNTLPLNEWHTIQLTRDRKKGSKVVNEEPTYTGESPGYFTGLDLEGNMYLGSVPNYDNIPRVTGFREGFVGSISEVRLKGIELNMGAEALEIVGVNQSNTCRNNPCINGGNCAVANTRYGFKCMCPQGFTGMRCEEIGERCYPGACGRGRCYNLEGRSGFRCICPLGKTGMGCQADVAIINPFFNRTSFISFPPSEDALFALQIQLEFKPQSLSDGIILYEGNDKDGTGDFMAIVQKDGYLEFRFDTGSGPAIIRSRNPLRVNEWTRVTATRKNREGTLVVNEDDPVTDSSWRMQNDQPAAPARFYTYYNHKFKRYRRGTSPGSTVGLNLKLPLYLGGPDPTAIVSPSTGVTRGFIGCVAELTVNDVKIDLLNDALESANIVDCGERRLCARQPCENDAICEDLPGPDYRCICAASHTGKNCEFEINICRTNSPCRNGAACSITSTGYRCDCKLGFAGDNCEYAINLNTQFSFAGDGFMMLPKGLLPHNKTQEKQTISFDISTTEQDGLILWQGGAGGKRLRGGDHISIGLKGGYLEFSYEMGSGPATIMSRKPVDDGLSHSVSVERIGRSGNLKVDNEDTVYGDSQGYLQMLNADGNIYLGGVSSPDIMTDGMFTDNFIGCIYNVKIRGKGPLQSRDAIEGYNVQACSP